MRVYQKRVRVTDELKQRLMVEVWSDFRQIIIDEAIVDEWRKRIEAKTHPSLRTFVVKSR